jgi:hypothetical protein
LTWLFELEFDAAGVAITDDADEDATVDAQQRSAEVAEVVTRG